MSILWIWEMTNNHDGAVEHAKRIIDAFCDVRDRFDLKAGIKVQLRQLETFIHKDFHDSDLKYIKRFKSTRLSMKQFREIIDHSRAKGFLTVATPFDNESLPFIDELDIDIVKVASCSVDDWPLLREISKINRKIIISTAGASMKCLTKVRDLFRNEDREFSFMHCVGEYPTPPEHAHLNRIDELRSSFSRLEIGISTHESPLSPSIIPFAVAKGCTIVEKHIDVKTADHEPNAYSCSPDQIEQLIEQVFWIERSLSGRPQNERESLRSLKRGVYTIRTIMAGEVIREGDLYYAMPRQDGQLDASCVDDIVGNRIDDDIMRDQPVLESVRQCMVNRGLVIEYVNRVIHILERASIPFSYDDDAELSMHYGIEQFSEMGALIINKVNREYCKKLIVMLPEQSHPSHHHIKKEETFELLSGDCRLTLNGKEMHLKLGKPVVIARAVVHSFGSSAGCVIEEVSTTHHLGDSIYGDPKICKLKLSDRKMKVHLVKRRM